MGCINSSTTKGLNDLRSSAAGVVNGTASVGLDSLGIGDFYDNVYRVRAVRLVAESNADQNGFLELNPREIIFVPIGNNEYPSSMVWNLQHLRRYGASGDTFSFEAGRRCMTGAGVFTFRLDEAEMLYRLFQRYINAVGTQTEDLRAHNNSEHHPSNTLGRLHVNTNNYLHPSLAQRTAAASTTINCENTSPGSLRLDSPDSPSINSNANEVVLFAHNSSYTTRTTAVEHITGNLYSERPLSSVPEQNNNNNNVNSMYNNDQSELSICAESGTASAFSTISRKLLIPNCSQDITINSLAMTPTTPLRLYANIDNWTDLPTNNSDTCYENVRSGDFPLLFPPITPVAATVPSVSGSNPTTPAATTNVTLPRLASIADPESMSLGSGGETSTQGASLVNYIVLDLDQPRSPVTAGSQYSPKTPFGSEFSISATNTEVDESSQAQNSAETTNNTTASVSNVTTCTAPTTSILTTTAMSAKKCEEEEQQLDYSTIDFVKTWALIESSSDAVDFDVDPDPDTGEEELRITRHSKCVRKAYSISE